MTDQETCVSWCHQCATGNCPVINKLKLQVEQLRKQLAEKEREGKNE